MSTSHSLCPEPPPPPGPLCTLLRACGTGPGLCPLRLLLDCLGRFSRLLWGFLLWWDALQGGHEQPPRLSVCLALGFELLFDVAQPVAQLGCEYSGIRLRHTGRCVGDISFDIPRHVGGKQDINRPAFLYTAQRTA